MAFIYNFTDTWNAGLTTYSAIKCSITDTASAADSALIDILVGGTSMFRVQKDGEVSTSHYYSAIQKWAKGSDIASASALTIPTNGNFFDVTGTTAITSISAVQVGTRILLQFDGILTLTHHATDLKLPGGANITTAAGDFAEFVEYASGDWALINYTTATANYLLNLVEDTTPQLGGDLDANGHDIDMGANLITDAKVGQWDTAYGWGDHAGLYALASHNHAASAIASGTLVHERGGLEADVSAYDGLLRISSGTTSAVPDASQAEMEAGSETALRGMSPVRIAQAIAALAPAFGGFDSVQVFTTSGTWTRPSGITKVLMFVTGGGGGGGYSLGSGNAEGGGGGGGTAIKMLDVSAIASSTITVGSGGSAGSDGGNSSWADGTNTITGSKGSGASGSSGASGGSASGGDLNTSGGSGSGGGDLNNPGGAGGGSFWGGGGAGGTASAGATGGAGGAAGPYGAGGGGGGGGDTATGSGGAGKAGVVFVMEFK